MGQKTSGTMVTLKTRTWPFLSTMGLLLINCLNSGVMFSMQIEVARGIVKHSDGSGF